MCWVERRVCHRGDSHGRIETHKRGRIIEGRVSAAGRKEANFTHGIIINLFILQLMHDMCLTIFNNNKNKQ